MKRRLVQFSVSTLFVAGATLGAACSSNKPAASPYASVDASVDGMAWQQAPSAPVASGAPLPSASSAEPVFFVDSGAPAPGPTASQSAGPTAPPMTDQAMDVAIDAIVSTAATKDAPKMAEENAPGGHQTMKEGDHFAMMVTLQPNRCYTFIASALPGSVSQLELHLYGPPFYNVEAGHSSPGEKALPVLGKGSAALCPMLPLAVPYKLEAVAVKGGGRVAVHTYSRSK